MEQVSFFLFETPLGRNGQDAAGNFFKPVFNFDWKRAFVFWNFLPNLLC